MLESNLIVLATPIYSWFCTPAMKIALDRYCKHSRLTYKGMLAERHMGYHTDFMDQEKAQHARDLLNQDYEPCGICKP